MADSDWRKSQTISDSIRETVQRAAQLVGGGFGKARDAMQNRPNQVDSAVDPTQGMRDAQTSDRHNGY